MNQKGYLCLLLVYSSDFLDDFFENLDKSEGEYRESGLECSQREILFMVISKNHFWTRITTTFLTRITTNWPLIDSQSFR